MNQKVKDGEWKDETGRLIPVKYIPGIERQKEKVAATIITKSLELNKKLQEFKTEVSKLCDEVYQKAMEKNNVDNATKGNFTFFNFDRSVKIEVSISERIDFDDLTIQACKQKLDEFLNENLDAKQEFVKELVTDAFSTSKGKLDSKKVMSLMRYRGKIKSPLFQDALDLLADSIRRPDSRKYFRVWERTADGKYELIDLNFSSI